MARRRYEVDPYNRLIITESGRGTGLPRFRQVIDGRFVTGPGNTLSYRVKAPTDRTHPLPHLLTLAGSWRLADDHTLRFALETDQNQPGRHELSLTGEIIDARGDSLLFAATTRAQDGTASTYVLTLTGRWQADRQNRLQFLVQREGGRTDTLTLQGVWEIGTDHRIVYRYERRVGRRGRSSVHELAFTGHWTVTGRTTLTYTIDAKSNSTFVFKTGIAVYEKSRITYEIGIGSTRRLRPHVTTLVFYGTWRITKNATLDFEIETTAGRLYTLSFGAKARLTPRDTIEFRLKTAAGSRDLGATFELSRTLLKGDGTAFIRLLASREESAVLVGAGFTW